MAITSQGVGSGLDVASLVSQLVAAERSPAENRLSLRETSTRTSLSALAIFKSAMSGFQTSVNALKGSSSSLGKLAATSSTPTLFTASTSAGAVAGSFSVEVNKLARASKMASDAYASADAVVGNGTVTLTVGAKSFNVVLTEGANTLTALRDKINEASDNSGVSATLLKESGGTRLILTSRETGLSKAATLSSAAEVGGASFVTMNSIQTALDAEMTIDGFAYTSASNTVSDAVAGVTFSLLKAEPGTVGTLGLTLDSAASTGAVESLVKSYNALVATVATYAKYDATTKSAGPLMGDAAVRTAMQQVRTVLGSTLSSGTYTVLSRLGISTQTDGSLKLDSAKLTTALQTDPQAVKSLFGGTGGFATRLATVTEGVLGTGGRLEAQTTGLQARLEDISDRRDALDLRMAAVQRRYLAQFTALDTLMGQLQTTSSYLTQQLANLPGSS